MLLFENMGTYLQKHETTGDFCRLFVVLGNGGCQWWANLLGPIIFLHAFQWDRMSVVAPSYCLTACQEKKFLASIHAD